MEQERIAIKPYLIEKLKQEHCLWSYENDSVQDIPDDVLVELVMLYLDIDEIDLLFQLLDYKKVKRAWIENVVAQGERYYNLNTFLPGTISMPSSLVATSRHWLRGNSTNDLQNESPVTCPTYKTDHRSG